MSQSDQPQRLTEQEKERYAGIEREITDIDTGASNPIQEAYGDDDGWKVHQRKGIKNFVDLYDSFQAPVRELLSNAQAAQKRRARIELERAGYDVPDSGFDVIDKCRESGVYEPVIEIEYHHGESPTLTISDNGIGISVKQWGVVQEIGLGTSHDVGTETGNFGQGLVSVFKIAELVKITTHSMIDGSNYAQVMTVSNPNQPAEDERESIGTDIRMVLSDEGRRNLEIDRAVEKYTGALSVPVVYRKYDTEGEEVHNDEIVPEPIDADFDDRNPRVVYEDQFVRAVASRSAPSDTYLVSMPIERNIKGYEGKYFDSPYQFDMRLKREDGPIYSSDDPDKIGKVPGRDFPQEDMEDTDKRMPKPAGSRDSLEEGRSTRFTRWVSKRLREQYNDMIADIMSDVDTPEDFLELDQSDQNLTVEAMESELDATCLGSTDDRKLDKLQQDLDETFDVQFDDVEVGRFSGMFENISLAPRDKREVGVSKKRNRIKRRIYEVIQKAQGGDVYMACSVNEDKAEVAWDMNTDNRVVKVDSTDEYNEYERLYGWKKLKEIDLYDLEQYDLADDRIEELRKTRGSGSGGVGPNSPDHPRQKSIVVRFARNGSASKMRLTVATIEDALDEGKSATVEDRYTRNPDLVSLLLYNNHSDDRLESDWRYANKSRGVGLARVPNYVYEYLTEESDPDNVYGDPNEFLADELRVPIETTDGRVAFEDLGPNDVVYATCDTEWGEDMLEYDPDGFRQAMIECMEDKRSDYRVPDTIERVAIVEERYGDRIHNTALMNHEGPTIVSTGTNRWFPDTVRANGNVEVYRRLMLPDWPDDFKEKYTVKKANPDTARCLIDNFKARHDQGLPPASED